MKYPKGLYLLFCTEMWERFSYYGMRAILILFLVKAMGFSGEDASLLYGDFTGLVYLTPLFGGYIADRYWGNCRSIIVGGILMAIGHFLLFLSASAFDHMSLYGGLLMLCIGNGFFKPNISTMVGQLYEKGDSRVDSSYTIFYMGINLGGFFSPLVCGTLGDTGSIYDFRWGFLFACIGMIVGVLCFVFFKDRYLIHPDGSLIGTVVKNDDAPGQNFNIKELTHNLAFFSVVFFPILYLTGCDVFGSLIYALLIVVPVSILLDKSLQKVERSRIIVIFVLAFFVIFFWAAYEQAGASLTLFADGMMSRDLCGVTIPTSYFQSLNPIFIVLLAPLVSSFWLRLSAHGYDVSVSKKQAVGMMLLAAGFLLLYCATIVTGQSQKIDMWWLVAYYFMATLGELALSPIGLSMVSKLSPARFLSMLMGVWFLGNAAAQKLCGVMSAVCPQVDIETGRLDGTRFLGIAISSMSDYFMLFVVMVLIPAAVLYLIASRLEKMAE